MRRLILLCAGQGARLRPFTDDRPKCMVPLHGRALVEWQLAAAREAGVSEVVIVRGYRGDQLDVAGATYVDNPRFADTNMVYSLGCARHLLTDGCAVSYGDIVYDAEVLRKMWDAPDGVSVAVDLDWLSYWRRRSPEPLADAETLRMDERGRIREIGQRPRSLDEIQGQYIGLTRYAGAGLRALVDALDRGEPGPHPTRSFAKLYMTDLLQSFAAGADVPVHAVPIHGGWLEIDNPDDLRLAESITRVAEGRLLIDR